MHDRIFNLIKNCLIELNEDMNNEKLNQIELDTPLYGLNGTLDSISLVRLLSELELVISEKIGKNIILSDEKAMSQKISPFRSVRSLAAYIEKLISEE